MDLYSPSGPGTWGQRTSKTTALSLPRARTRQPGGGHHHGRVSAALLVCDICPAVLCLWAAVAPEADRYLRGASCLEEAEVGLPGIAYVSGMATSTAATGTQHGSLGLWFSPG